MGLKEKIRADNERQINEAKRSGRFFENNVIFDTTLGLDDRSKEMANKLFNDLNLSTGYKEKEKLKDLEILLANLIKNGITPIAISMDRNHWRKDPNNPVSYFILDLIRKFTKEKLIEKKPGYYSTGEKGRLTRISSTLKLLQLFPYVQPVVKYKPTKLVEVRDNKKEQIAYSEGNRKIQRIEKILKKVNTVNRDANIILVKGRRQIQLNTSIVAMFKTNLKSGGRMYARGSDNFQRINRLARNKITINGNPTIEKDFKGMHPYLLYAEEGIPYKEDPYSIGDNNPIIREFLKIILLCMINTKSKKQCLGIVNTIYKAHIEYIEALKMIGIERPYTLINKFIEVHERIKHNFFKGEKTGQKLTNADSQIALEVLDHFASKNIPILNMHDSFIVEVQYEKELEQVMKVAYKNFTGYECIVK